MKDKDVIGLQRTINYLVESIARNRAELSLLYIDFNLVARKLDRFIDHLGWELKKKIEEERFVRKDETKRHKKPKTNKSPR